MLLFFHLFFHLSLFLSSPAPTISSSSTSSVFFMTSPPSTISFFSSSNFLLLQALSPSLLPLLMSSHHLQLLLLLVSFLQLFPPSPSQLLPPLLYKLYSFCSSSIDLNSARRKNATRESTATLKAWLQEHIKNPYPTKGEKIMLAIITKMTLTQVSTWFANARRRLKKENKMTWSPRNRGEDEAKESEDESLSADNKSDYGRGPDLTPLNTAPGKLSSVLKDIRTRKLLRCL